MSNTNALRHLICILFLLCLACASTSINKASINDDQVVIENKDIEYKIIIIEPGFNSWLATQPPENFYSQSTLEIKNRRWTIEWNNRVLQPNRYPTNLYDVQINYDAHTDYGLEVNYKLFMYYTYFQQKYKQKL